jgi:hypothetical protein
MPDLIRFYIRHTAIGFALAAVFVAMLLWFNVANLWHLVSHSPDGVLAVALLWMFNGIVLGGAQFGIAVMGMAEKDDDPEGGQAEPVAIPVRVER